MVDLVRYPDQIDHASAFSDGPERLGAGNPRGVETSAPGLLVNVGRHSDQIDQRIAAQAVRQQGFVTRAQLLKLGLTASGIKRRVAAGRLLPAYTGVYAVAYLRRDPVARAAAAVLACGPKAVLSHHSAAALWSFRKWRGGAIDVTAPGKHRRRGISSHRCALTRREVTTHYGIRVTTVARTLVDIAPALDDRQLMRAINDALISNHLRDGDLTGTRLERFVGELSRSPLEDDFRPWLRAFGLPEPLYNVVLYGHELDAYYPAARLIVGVDGWPFHRTKSAFENDRERDAAMLAVGIVTIRTTRKRLEAAPRREADRLRTNLQARLAKTREAG